MRIGRARARYNPRAMSHPLIVMKFGGSSVGNADRIRRVARRIAAARAEGADLCVVVSAMGDTTDELLSLAAAITDEPDARELDMLLATGEHQSATLMSMALDALGVPAIALTGAQAGIVTDGTYGKARIAGIDPVRIRAEMADGRVVIVAGFQGQSAKALELMETTTLGRGGSDTTAVALAAALHADRCQIYTDVKGIYTADPRLVPDARQLPVIGYEEMLELAHQGAQVMQVRAVELGWVNDVVIEVLSSFEDAPGTLIKEDPLVEQRNKVRGIAHDRNVAKITLVEVPDRPGVAHAVFAPLAEAGISVDMIVQNVGHGVVDGHELHRAAGRAGEGEAGPRADRPRPRLPGDDDRRGDRQGLDRRGRPPQRPGLRGPDVRRALRGRREHRDDLDLRGPDHLHDRGGPAGGRGSSPPRRVRADEPGAGRRGRRGPVTAFPARQERFEQVASTNDVVRGWLAAGTPEVCLAVADEQRPAAGAPGGRGPPRRAPRSSSRSGSGRPGSSRATPGGWRRSSRWRWPTRPSTSRVSATGRSASSGRTTS